MTATYTTGYLVPYTSNQDLVRQREVIKKEAAIAKMHELRNNVKSPLFYRTPEQIEQARSVFGVRLRPRPKEIRMYDRIHKPEHTWDQKVKKDTDSTHVPFMNNARKDEDNRQIPVMTNSEYGHRLPTTLEPFSRDHVVIKTYHGSIYRNNGVNIGTP